ncbi:MAG TPA: DJ-1/PfpI family protein [Thermoanaerobaculia bacterium]|nr:DJ-1/PfpI family protein [Thermoanaerobaculia bacterium]
MTKRVSLLLLVILLGAWSAQALAEDWVCPMTNHAKVFAAPGDCPQCGMALVKRADRDKRLAMEAEAAAGRGAGADIKPPANGKIPVAFVISKGAVMIDFTGPWEVFQDVYMAGRGKEMDDQMPFQLFTVSDSRNPIHVSGGMTIVPDYTFDNAPTPRVIIVPAQGSSDKMLQWLRAMHPKVDVLASVCTGAFIVARAGLLDGKEATTHHDSYGTFATQNPKVKLVRGRRYVQSDAVVSTAGGLSSGIDLALHIVQRYFGRDVAEQTAEYMEYQGTGWKTPATTGAALSARR